ncbi:MAG: GntR family transcriptional regulator [Clostridia bacterium]|nr:GntR family transcriptional regulator [Clostridia bacterium]
MIRLNSHDPRPIYEQIMENLRRLIVSGAMAPGEKLPSVRELAIQLAINPNTIQRAYRELENEGYIVTLPGKGSFVARIAAVEQSRIRALWQQLDAAAEELRFAGVSEDELLMHIRKGEQHD